MKIFRAFQDDPTTALGTSSNTIPQILYLKHDLLSKFRLFKWMYQNKHIQCNHFENLKIPEKLVDTQREFVSLTQYIHSTDYIWDNMIFHHWSMTLNISPISILFPVRIYNVSKRSY